MGNTKVDLVRDLKVKMVEEYYSEEKVEAIDKMISRAQRGYYHDFETELAAPKMQLHKDLLSLGLDELDKKMQQGAYDDESPSPEEAKRLMDLLKKS